MQIVNLVNRPSYSRTPFSADDPMSVETVEISYDYETDVQWVIDPDTKTMLAVPTEDLTDNDMVVTLPEYFDDEVMWIVASQIGLVNRHKVFVSIMNLGDCFLVALHKGALGFRSEGEGTDDAILLTNDYSGSATIDDCVWYTPDTFPTMLLKNPGHHGIFNVSIKILSYRGLDISIGKWENSIDTELVLNPKFYLDLKAQRAAELEAAEKTAAAEKAERERQHEMELRKSDASRVRNILSLFSAQGTPIEG